MRGTNWAQIIIETSKNLVIAEEYKSLQKNDGFHTSMWQKINIGTAPFKVIPLT